MFQGQNRDLLVNRELTLRKGNFVIDLHLVEKPVRIALQNLRQMHADVARRFPEAIHDAAQGSFMNAQHACQTVLPDAGGVHPQLKIGINVSIQGHGLSHSVSMSNQHSAGTERLLLPSPVAITVPNLRSYICQHIVDTLGSDNSQTIGKLPEVLKGMTLGAEIHANESN
jgi:hypothetical protein